MTRLTQVRAGRLEPAWLVPVLLAAVAGCLTARNLYVMLPLLVVALLPWGLALTVRILPNHWFGLIALVPVAVILALNGVSGVIFLATTTLCHLASRTRSRPGVGALVAIGLVIPFVGWIAGPAFDFGAIYFAIGNVFGVVVGVLLGRSRRLGEELRAADNQLAALRSQEDRARLARDVHDLVAHSLTVVILHVGAARRVLRTDPAGAENALLQAERVGRESLDGVRQVVGLLRAGDAPVNATLDIKDLAETYRAASVPVDLEQDSLDQAPLLVRATLYRVVQEALANAARYRTPGSTVAVQVRVDHDAVTAQISNETDAPYRNSSGGYGLAGLREQVTAIGGTLRSGHGSDSWEVLCRLPLDASTVRHETNPNLPHGETK